MATCMSYLGSNHLINLNVTETIYYNLDVSFPQASLGDEIKVPTLNGNVMLTIPSGTQTGKQFRLKIKVSKMFMDMVMVIYLLILK